MGSRPLWLIILAVWGIASGLLVISNLTIAFAPIILAVLLIAFGILALFGK